MYRDSFNISADKNCNVYIYRFLLFYYYKVIRCFVLHGWKKAIQKVWNTRISKKKSELFLQNFIFGNSLYEAGIYFGYITSALPMTHPACNTISLKKDDKILDPYILQVNNNMTKTLIEEIINHETWVFSGHSLQWFENSMTWWMLSVIASSKQVHKPPHTASYSLPISLPLFYISLHYFFTPCALRKSLACKLRDIHHVERHPETQRESNICCSVQLLFSVWACGVLSNDCTAIVVWQSDVYPQTVFPAPAEEIQKHT